MVKEKWKPTHTLEIQICPKQVDIYTTSVVIATCVILPKNRELWWRKVKRLAVIGELNPGLLVWAAGALPLSYDNQTTSNPHNPLHVLHRWCWIPQSDSWRLLSMCHTISARGAPHKDEFLKMFTHCRNCLARGQEENGWDRPAFLACCTGNGMLRTM